MPYRVRFDLEGFPNYEYLISLGNTEDNNVNVGTLTVGRIGGPSDRDREQQDRIFHAVGRATVASGHIEAGMKRLVIVLRHLKNQFSLVDKTWTDLERILEKESERVIAGDEHAELRRHVGNELKLASKYSLKAYRDNIVHGYIWDFDMPVLLVGRFKRQSDGATLVWTIEEFETVAVRLYIYGLRLDSLVHGIWPEALLETHDPILAKRMEDAGFIERPDVWEEIDNGPTG